MQLAVADLLEVLGVGHAAIDHHRGPLRQPDAVLQEIEDPAQRLPVLGIAGEDLMGQGEAFPADDQPDHHLLAIRAMVAGIAPLRLGIAGGLSLEIGAGQVVEIDRRIELKQSPFPLDQVGFDGGALGMESVEVAIEGVVGQGGEIRAQDVGQRGGADPAGHGVFTVGVDQAVQGHGTGELDGAGGEAVAVEDGVEFQPLPELEADMDGPGGSHLGHGDAVGVDGDQIAVGGGWRCDRGS